MSAAERAWMKGSRRAREKAAARTLARVCEGGCQHEGIEGGVGRALVPRFLAILPRQIVVFVRMPGCSSFAVLARYRRSSPLMMRSESLGTTTNTALTVCSRTRGATSVKPVTFHLSEIACNGLLTYHLWEDVVVDKFLWDVIYHIWQVIQETYSHNSIL
jgi:hypothetical protein